LPLPQEPPTSSSQESKHVMPGLPIIDAHQHFWDLTRNYLPWLVDEPPIPFRYGNYAPLKRNYMPQGYGQDTHGFKVVGTVFVETEWDPRDPVGETRWIHDVAMEHGLPSAVVAHANLAAADVADILTQQACYPLVRGIRDKPRAASTPDRVVLGAPGSMDDQVWRRGYALLSAHGLSFDLQTPWWHLEEATRLNADFPNTMIILNHTGLPADRSAEGLAAWRQAMERFARAPNVAVKISGLGEPGVLWSADRNRNIVLTTINIFGPERCMLASNFPVDGLVGDFATIYAGFIEITDALGERVQRGCSPTTHGASTGSLTVPSRQRRRDRIHIARHYRPGPDA
jgi:predicted TIM-barrel fold metal-dependent hydrolase